MVKQIFVNLPIKDLGKTRTFWESLGFSFNPQFSDDKAGALVLGENIFAMLLTEEYFKSFIKKGVVDTTQVVEVITAIGVESREKVNELVEAAVAAGGNEYKEVQDHGWMYLRAFEDIDGHLWEVTFMDLSQLPQS